MMNDIQRVSQNQTIVTRMAHYDKMPPDAGSESNSLNLWPAMQRHWRALVVIFIITAGLGIPFIWFAVKPMYESAGAIRISPIVPSILFSDRDSEQAIPNYQNFMNTQAELIASFQVLNRAADDLKTKDLIMIGRDPYAFLRDAVSNGTLIIEPAKKSELIRILIKNKTPREGEQIVNAIIRAYMAVEVSNSVRGGDEKLGVLEDEYRTLSEKLQRQRKIVRQMSEEFGTAALTGRQDMMLQQVTMLQSELTKLQTHKISLEAQIEMLEKAEEETLPLEKVMEMKSTILKNDIQMTSLSNQVSQLEQGLIVANQTLTAENPEIKRRTQLLEMMKKKMMERERELTRNFNDMLTKEVARNRNYKLKETKTELARSQAYEEKLMTMLSKHNSQTIELGRKQLAIQDQKEQFALTEEMYNTVRRRIQELEMERKRPARISIAFNADSMLARDKRPKYIAANIFGSGFLAILAALLLDKLDRRLHTPEDITRRLGLRIIGTTIASEKIETALLCERIADDYQTIRTNLGLYNEEKIPHILAVTSARPQEGKTTFAVNLASSMAKAGARVLLIDGDLRKPDIAKLLNIETGDNALRKVLLGYATLDESVWPMPAVGLDVLISDSNDAFDAFELLTRPQTAQRLKNIASQYEHVIIDTPPVLAVPDAIIWAKMADAVVLASYAGQTQGPDVQRAIERLTDAGVKLIGTVLNNVQFTSSYNEYGYGYYGTSQGSYTRRPPNRRAIMMPVKQEDSAEVTSAAS